MISLVVPAGTTSRASPAHAWGAPTPNNGYISTQSIQRFVAFALVGLTYLFWLRSSADRVFWYDAGAYWGSVKSYSLNDYDLSYRGYSYPYLCFLLRQLAGWLHVDPRDAFWTASSVLMATLGTIVVPSVVTAVVPACKPRFLSILAFNGLVFLFFHGYANYPLSDIPAIAVLLAALWLTKIRVWGLVPGVLLGLAINFRPVYLISMIPITVLVAQRAMLLWRNERKPAAFGHFGAFVVGLCIVLGPQVYINHHTYKRLSVLPPTDLVYGQGLYLYQLQTGIGVQKFETNVGVEYPDAQVRYADPTGRSILASAKAESYGDLLALYAKYPIEFAAIYARHVFSGLDVKFPTVYVKNPYANAWWRSLINYSVIFLFISACRHVAKLRVNKVAFSAAIAAPILPVLAAIPATVEVRFFLPLYLLMYTVVAVAGAAELHPRTWTLTKTLLYCTFLVVCCTLSDNAYACTFHTH